MSTLRSSVPLGFARLSVPHVSRPYAGGWKHAQGMNWIFLGTRMAIYARDRFDCTWCRQVFPVDIKGYGLSLDHLHDPMDHSPANLVTSCMNCNSSRKATPLGDWLRGRPTERGRLKRTLSRPLDRKLGSALAKYRKGKIEITDPSLAIFNTPNG